MKLQHIGLEVFDIYNVSLFYQKYFDFKVVYNYVSKNTPGLKTIFLKNCNFQLELLQRDRNESYFKSKSDSVFFHINFKVKNVEEEYKRLKKLGIEVSQPRLTGDGFVEFSLLDPENNLIEISSIKHKYKKPQINAVIFDFDGTLVDSEENYYKADKILLSQYDIHFTEDMKKKYIGTGNLEMMKQIKEAYSIKDSVETLLEKKNSIYLDIARKDTKIFPEMKKLIEILKKNDYPIAIASGSSPIILKELLSKLSLTKYFDVVVSAEDVKKGKPAPDIFLEAAKRLEVNPENCLVLEDSVYGVEAAKRSFMYCMAIPYLIEKPLNHHFLSADYLYKNGIKDFRANKTFSWIKSI
ncbi:MAG TPA: beta-phosphoglucomutase family hydrolase [Spirochaetota bacterium]|nr:beta-phosphoglucomutase family hydrolase [Spirochaetota bacterium]